MAKKIVFTNSKGGVGKSTSVVNVAAILADMGYKVLIMDFDPQASATISLGIDVSTIKNSIKELFEDECKPNDAVIIKFRNISIIPARYDLRTFVNSEKANHFRRNEIIKFRVGRFEEEFDYILMDTAPAAQGLLATNALALADYVIIPSKMEHLSVVGIAQMLDVVRDVRGQYLNPDLKILGILATMVENTNDCADHTKLIFDTFSNTVFNSTISKNVTLSESASMGKPIIYYRKDCRGAINYIALTNEIIQRIERLPV